MGISQITFRILLITLLVMIFTGKDLYALDPESKSGEAKITELKILTWNIYMLPLCAHLHRNWKRAEGISREIIGYHYDIIVFEEAFDNHARKIIRNQLKEVYPFIYGPANESAHSFRTNSGIWILSKIPLRQLEQIEFKNRIGIDAIARKGAVLFEGDWHGQSFQLLGTHLQNDSPDAVRYGQCEEISEKHLRKYAKSEVPQIVCGDFNIEYEDKLNYSTMLSILEAKNGNLNGELQTSFDEVNNKLAYRKNGKKQLIDYILVRNNDSIKDITRKVSKFKNHAHNVSTDLSDHYGIEAIIHFKNQPSETLTLLH